MAELLVKATGMCKGKGGSMHMSQTGIGFLGCNAIVSGHIAIAGGELAPAAKGGGCRHRCSAGRTPGAIFVGTVAGAHLPGVCAQVQRLQGAAGAGAVVGA